MSGKKDRKKKGQPIPRFEEGEIDFLINREFPERAQEVCNKFSGLQEFWINTTRTKAAILKLADGDFDKIKELIKKANRDPRDVIAFAEYPCYTQMDWDETNEMSQEEKQVIFDNDWEKYRNWKNKGK